MSARSHMSNLLENLEIAKRIADQNIQHSQTKNKTYYDKKQKHNQFELGDEVLLHNTRVPQGTSAKCLRPFEKRYYIVKLGPNDSYYIRSADDHKIFPHAIHHNRLKPYKNPEHRILRPPPQKCH